MPQPDRPPSKAENDAWFAYRAIASKQGRESGADVERVFRDGWRQGCAFTFGATSQLSPAIAAFIDWMQYVTDWSAPSFARGEGTPADTDDGHTPAAAHTRTE